MRYLSSFVLSEKKKRNPNLYPFNVFQGKSIMPLVFSSITIFYGNNGCGKSTLLNLIAQKLNIKGFDRYGFSQLYIEEFLEDCFYGLADDDEGITCQIPPNSRYIKSEDILFEIKKIQQEEALERGYVYEQVRKGMSKQKAKIEYGKARAILKFAQEKYSNGETAMQLLMDQLVPNALYLLDEPEVSLSPQNQVKLAEEINELARFCDCQFIIATHSPFMLGTLQAKIYNLDLKEVEEARWSELENVRYFYDFFQQRSRDFE